MVFLFRKILRNTLFLASLMGYFIAFSNFSYGATQGTAGSTSQGSIEIDIALSEVVQISYLDDIVFPVWGGSGDMTEFDDLCIYSNTAGGSYNVEAAGSGAAGDFTVTDGSNILAYNAYWNDVSGTSTGMQALTKNIPLSSTGANGTSVSCSNGSSLTARIIIEFLDANLGAAVVSVYNGTLTFTITPI